MIFYIHGFASGKNSSTIKRLQNAIGENDKVNGLEYNSTDYFNNNLRSLKKQIDEYKQIIPDTEPIFIIGTSLGGFYAIQLSNILNYYVICTVFNPVVYPLIQMKQFVNIEHRNFCTNEKFIFTEDLLKSYEQVNNKLKLFPLTIYVSENDELLIDNVRYVEEKYSKRAKIVHTHTKHRIDNFSPYVQEILDFIWVLNN